MWVHTGCKRRRRGDTPGRVEHLAEERGGVVEWREDVSLLFYQECVAVQTRLETGKEEEEEGGDEVGEGEGEEKEGKQH